jgi:hypothetical protein
MYMYKHIYSRRMRTDRGIHEHTSAYVSMRQHMSAYASIRQHASAVPKSAASSSAISSSDTAPVSLAPPLEGGGVTPLLLRASVGEGGGGGEQGGQRGVSRSGWGCHALGGGLPRHNTRVCRSLDSLSL